ncbi:hypothetical protein IMG5_102700 [Ichthyophthirius multifiliis]|uniref:Maltase n=1 Tax=Ichthyophthirius multifiliis TaxID=5932 RepID=G0QSQ4_ICHMU|nr:hypothetical protein IMG5_102700 [Ichthyophthirius multifiliis]EGR31770.1 hypothetical protein IMG5_102700 [Ichthyophthirius multifiliis]|eukprot:XP_004035256.1 hypothetical protein IMG5_102700 [Ichthyophthirius multifiliis]
MNNEKIFGLGERRSSFQYSSGKYTIWNADAARIDNGTLGQQIYGAHPMYLRKEHEQNKFHVVFLRNSYGMEIDYEQNQSLMYKVIGGNFDFKFFLGNNPEEVIKMYHQYVNGWILHPFWVQGFHQCRWGYNNSDQLQEVWNKFNQLQIPLDSLWTDIDYMNSFQDFTLDQKRFNLNTMKKIYNLSDNQGVHWSSIIDVGIAINSDYAKKGIEMNTFIQSAKTNKPLVGSVWPGDTYYPDFNHPNSTQFWFEGFQNLTQTTGLQQDGIWIDMNEFSNFVNGEIIKKHQNVKLNQQNNDIPFNPQGNQDLEFKTLSLDAKQYNKQDAELIYIQNYNLTQYDMHNLNGFSESIATYKIVKKMGKKLTFILSRSTLFGSGKFVQHWNGDGFSNWDYLRLSIPGIMNFQMFGIPLVGDDIGGLNGNVTPQLLARWQQLGSLYPFSRNHNGIGYISQEPYAFPDYPYVLQASLNSLNIRYQLLKFYYHLFVRQGGVGTVFRPLFFEFPNDLNTFDIEFQFMLGEFLLAAPVLKEGNEQTQSTLIDIYIPEGDTFYDFYSKQPYKAGKQQLDVPFSDYVPLFIRGGKIVHIQDNQNVLRTSGSMLTIEDYNNDDNIVNNCQENNNNCVMNIFAQDYYCWDQSK